MRSTIAATAAAFIILASGTSAQKPGAKPVKYDVTITADGGTYTGTMDLAVVAGKVAGDMRITKPSEITGKPAGTVKAGAMKLNFPYRMVERGCDGQIEMDIKMPPKPGSAPATGTVSIAGCGRPDTNKLPGTIELKPQAPAAKK